MMNNPEGFLGIDLHMDDSRFDEELINLNQDSELFTIMPTPIGGHMNVVNSVPKVERVAQAQNSDDALGSLFLRQPEPNHSLEQNNLNGLKSEYVKGKDPSFLSLSSLYKSSLQLQSISQDRALENIMRIQRHQINPQQEDRWHERYQELIRYRGEHGHCNVPYKWAQNPALAQWVKRQRHQYKLKHMGKHSNLSDDREDLLRRIGFVWDSRETLWDERFQELVRFKAIYGHCKVTRKYKDFQSLAAWLKRQRHIYRASRKGGKTPEVCSIRIKRLLQTGVDLEVVME